jgi:DNA primase
MAKTLLEVLPEKGVELIPSSNGRWVATCPFHKGDRDPSFTVYPTDTYFCFGCHIWGDALSFLLTYCNMSPKEALEYVGEDYSSRKFDKKQVIKVKNTVLTWAFLHDVAKEYHDFLQITPGAVQYLKNRGLKEETIKKYMLGYTDGRVLSLRWAVEQEMGLEVGLINERGNELLSHRITIPNLLGNNECDFIVGRTVTNDRLKYLGLRMPKPLFGFYSIRHSPVVFVVEGQFDWLILKQWGYPALVLGGSHLPKVYDHLLIGKKLIVLPDQDDVGFKAAAELQRRFSDTYIIDYSDLGVHDIGDLGKVEDGEYLLKQKVLEQAGWIRLLSPKILEKWFPNLAT